MMKRRIKTPTFWYKPSGLLAKCLSPLAIAYSAISKIQQKTIKTQKVSVPVICIGNLVVGGAGKTPTVIALAKFLQEKGYTPHILSRGYGTTHHKPIRVDLRHHGAKDVGDEPLLLAKQAPTWVGGDRVQSAQQAIGAGADIILMDDGFQNPSLYKDLSLLVIDGSQGLGNGCVVPAGPLRESVQSGFCRADVVIVIGEDRQGVKALVQRHNKPLIEAEIRCFEPHPTRVIAFSGLGYPEKFYRTLEELKYNVLKTFSFPDHHPYTAKELDDLIQLANDEKAQLITTEKDLLRVPSCYHGHIQVLKIELSFVNSTQLENVLKTVILKPTIGGCSGSRNHLYVDPESPPLAGLRMTEGGELPKVGK